MNRSAGHVIEREIKLLLQFYGTESFTKGHHARSAVEAGYPEAKASASASAVLYKYNKLDMAQVCEKLGLNKTYVAIKLKEILEDRKVPPHTRADCLKLLLAIMGEDSGKSGTTVNVQTPRALVIVGTSKSKIDRMTRPSVPELPEHAG